jgi:DNA-binding LacI/PurR family transcriptional regulator
VVRSLVASGILNATGKGLASPLVESFSGKSAIVLFTAEPEDPPTLGEMYQGRTRLVSDRFERACSEGGLRIRFEKLDPLRPAPQRELIRRLNRNPEIVGYVVNTACPASGQWNTDLIALIDSLASAAKPTAIIDYYRTLPLNFLRSGSHLRVFRIVGETAGEHVAASVLARGHRRVAFVCDWNRFSWSVERLRGIRKFFEYAPAGCRLLEYVSDVRDGPYQLTFNALDLDDRSFGEIFSVGSSAGEFAKLARRNQEVRGLKLFDHGDRSELEKSTADFLCIRRLLKSGMPAQDFARVRETQLSCLYERVSPIHSRRLFRHALRERTVTCWLFSCDTNAHEGLDFLADEGVGVPDGISVVSFDNMPRAFDRSLASYDFNMPAFVTRSLDFVMGPNLGRGGFVEPVVDVAGMLIERRSLGRVS